MKKLLLSLIAALTCCCLQAQEYTFEKQREQALLEFHRDGTQLVTATCKTRNGSAITEYQLSAIAAVMEAKDGFVRLVRKSNTEVAVIYAPFIPETDVQSVFRHAGVLVIVEDTQAIGMELLQAQ